LGHFLLFFALFCPFLPIFRPFFTFLAYFDAPTALDNRPSHLLFFRRDIGPPPMKADVGITKNIISWVTPFPFHSHAEHSKAIMPNAMPMTDVARLDAYHGPAPVLLCFISTPQLPALQHPC